MSSPRNGAEGPGGTLEVELLRVWGVGLERRQYWLVPEFLNIGGAQATALNVYDFAQNFVKVYT